MRFSFILFSFSFLLNINLLIAQRVETVLHVKDITNFWSTYDSIVKISSEEYQLAFMKSNYLDKGSDGLKAFMKLRNFDEIKMVESINKYPKFWTSIRPNTLKVEEKENEIGIYIRKFQQLYPNLKKAKIYFCITPMRSGGTTIDSLVLVGTEIATGNKETDVSELPNKRLEKFFSTQTTDNIVPFTVHEYVHTQQRIEGKTVLGQSIYEGVCEFITEIILEKPLQHRHILYGRQNEEALKQKFKSEMYSTDLNMWLYNGNEAEVGDLGYFMGYAICKAYHTNAKNKQKAIIDMIELDHSNDIELKKFFKKAKYFID